MSTRNCPSRPCRPSRPAVLMATALLLSVLAVTPAGYAGGGGQPGHAARLFDLAKPAVVCIFAVYGAHITVPLASFPESRQELLKQRLIAKVQAGELSADDESAIRVAAVEEILNNIFDYLVPTSSKRSFDPQIVMQGSGFFITPDGYLVTNAHVVTEDEEALKNGFARDVLVGMVKQDIKDFTDAAGGEVSQDLIDQLIDAAFSWYAHYMEISDLDKKFLAAPGLAVGGKNAEEKALPAEIKKVGQPTPGKDVAILKVEGTNFVTTPLGEDTALRVGDQIYAIGYPGDASFQSYLKQTSPVEPTFTRGVVSARKKMEGGWDALQTDAAVTHGNSGGPAIDESGRVIGLVTWGTTSESQSSEGETEVKEVAGMNFLVPVSVVKEFIKEVGVQPEQGPTTVLWRRAMEKMDVAHYKSAVRLLNQVKDLAPNTPWVEEYISTAQTNIQQGKDQSWKELVPAIVIIAVVVIAVVALAIVLVTRSGKRGKAQPVMPGYTGGGPAPMPPAAQPMPPAQAPPPQPAPPQAPPPQAPPPTPPAAPKPPMPPPPPPPRPG